MIRKLDSAWRIVLVVIIIAIWAVVIGLCKLYDKGVDLWEEFFL